MYEPTKPMTIRERKLMCDYHGAQLIHERRCDTCKHLVEQPYCHCPIHGFRVAYFGTCNQYSVDAARLREAHRSRGL